MEEWAAEALTATGYYGLTAFMLLINLFPPLPAESAIPLTGALIEHHQLTRIGAIGVATLGLVLGTLPFYIVGRVIGEARIKQALSRHGHWLALSPSDIDRSATWFKRYGPIMILIGRVIPGMRSLVSIPAGFYRMPIGTFLLYTALGSALWATLLICLGNWLFDRFPAINGYTVVGTILAIFIGLYATRLTRHYMNRSKRR
ncbi:DedA family protein [Phytohalomonas tamaricis]|uniref:DedA family protein n=1 Tax=Phytohalomonas tamaricis TaxID=2081032 RepID=UPI000D0B37BA|nr:DedA family protein [Phytohalomonas tamaricis]